MNFLVNSANWNWAPIYISFNDVSYCPFFVINIDVLFVIIILFSIIKLWIDVKTSRYHTNEQVQFLTNNIPMKMTERDKQEYANSFHYRVSGVSRVSRISRISRVFHFSRASRVP